MRGPQSRTANDRFRDRVRKQGKTSFIRQGAPWAAGSLMLVLAAAVLYVFTGAAASEPSHAQPVGAGDITYGPSDASLTVIEYSDFECPFCAEYATIMAQLRREYGDRVQFVFRFFPLDSHKYGMVSAQAAYAASLQGKFWEMHDLLFERQEEWASSADPSPLFDSYAEGLGLDVERFRSDMAAPATTSFIEAQRSEGTDAGVDHTPWFVIGDSAVLPRSVEDFQRLIEAEL
jgi:protein-disulfide isomerase